MIRKRLAGILLAVAAVTAAIIPAGLSASAAGTTCTTSAQDGTCGPWSAGPAIYSDNGAPWVVQDIWNPSANWQQTLNATDAGDWSVTASMAAGNKAVVSYPDTQDTLTLPTGTPALSQFGSSLISTYSQGDPAGAGQDYEWAYDLWLSPQNGPAWQNDLEVMVWTDNHGQTPAGSDSGRVYTAPDGTQYEVWLRSGASNVSSYGTISLVRKANAQSGTVDLDSVVGWLKSSGMVAASASYDQIDYGLEICSTGGASLTYPLTGYTLVVNGTAPAPTPTATTPVPTPTPTATTPAPTPTPTATATQPPVLTAPGSLSQTPHVLVNFGWGAVSGASAYEFQLDTSSGTVVDDVTVSALNVAGVEVAKDSKYKWRVRAVGGPWTSSTSFTAP